jgi:hypothetical protein
MTNPYDIFPSSNPQRDHDKARARAVRAREAIAEFERIITAGCDISGDVRNRLFQARMALRGAQDEMAAMVRQGANPSRRMTAAECAEELRRLRGEAPRKSGPVYLRDDGRAIRKVTPQRQRSLGYITKVVRAGD